MELTTIPLQDGFTTKLAQEWDGSTGTMFLQASPSFTFPSGETTYMVVQPNGANAKLIEIDSYDSGNNTVNVLSVTLLKGAGINNPTGVTYPTNTEVLISDNYQFWKDIQDAIATKLNLDETSTIEDSVKIQFGSASAYIYTDDSGVNLKFKDANNAEATLSDILAQGGADRKAAISDNDTTPGQLDDKISVGDGLSKSIGTPAGDETLDLDLDIKTDNGLKFTSGQLDINIASESDYGTISIATEEEAIAGIDDTKAMTPLKTAGIYDLGFEVTNGTTNTSFTAANQQSTTSDTYVKVKEIKCTIPGTYSISHNMWGSGELYSQIYKNGTPFGIERYSSGGLANPGNIYTESLTFDSGDLIQLYIKNGGLTTTYILNLIGKYDTFIFNKIITN